MRDDTLVVPYILYCVILLVHLPDQLPDIVA